MSTLYLFDTFSTPLSAARILDIKPSEIGAEIPINGRFVVRADDNIQLPEPTDLNTLLTDKYAATLATYPGFTDIVYDDMLNASGLGTSEGTTVLTSGERGTVSIYNGYVETTDTVIGSAPSQTVVLWELFGIEIDDILSSGTMDRKYVEADPSGVTVEVSFNGGSTWTTVTHGVLASILPADQGTTLRLRFDPVAGAVFLGSWSVVY